MTGRRRTLAAVGLVVAIGVTVVVPRLRSGSGSEDDRAVASLTTATVQRTDLAETTPVEGVVRFGAPSAGSGAQSVIQPGGADPAALAQLRDAVASAEQGLGADRQAAADDGAASAASVAAAEQSLAIAQQSLDAAATARQRAQQTLADDRRAQQDTCRTPSPDGGPSERCLAAADRVSEDQRAVDEADREVATASAEVTQAESERSATELAANQTANQAAAKVGASELALSSARSAELASLASQTGYGPTSRYTSLPAVGAVVEPGQALWSVDGHQVALLSGTLTPWRAFYGGMAAGPDVAALHQALIALGHGAGLSESPEFTAASSRAIERLQAALGEPRTGTLALGSVVFEPGAVRVAAVHSALGALVAAGSPVLDVTSTSPIVEVALPVAQSHLVELGDSVTVTLPDRTTSDGTISAIGSVATTASDANGSEGSGSSSPPRASVSVTITLAQQDGAARLDQAPVTVNITSSSVTDVLAVPTTALVALAGGGYALEVVVPGRPHRLVPVELGIFDEQAGLVEVSGEIAEGQKVVAPA